MNKLQLLIAWVNKKLNLSYKQKEKDKETKRFQKWRCNECSDEFVTDRMKRHLMVYCKNKCSAVDAEQWYVRKIGDVSLIQESDNKLK